MQEDETLDEQIIVVKAHLYLGMPISEVSRKYNIDIKVVRLYIKKFKQSLKLRKRANIKYLGKNKKLKEEHKETLKELINNQVNCILTLDDMRAELLKRHPEISSVSTTTLSRWLKQELGMSYKKMSRINHKALNQEDACRMIKCAALIKKLLEKSIECIFVDEFSIDARRNKQYGWSKRGSKSLFPTFSCSFRWSFMIGLSQNRYYKVYGVTK